MEILWSYSGGAVRFVAEAAASLAMFESGQKHPTIVCGVSAGALLAPIIAVATEDIEILHKAIEVGKDLDMEDMFPSKAHRPVGKKGNFTVAAYSRAATGWNHLGIQNIMPLYTSFFTEEYFKVFKASKVKCYAFGVLAKNMSPEIFCLNDAKSVEDLVYMIEASSRISPIVQPADYEGEQYIDGGFISFNPAYWIMTGQGISKFKTLRSFYTNTLSKKIKTDEKWDDNILTIFAQLISGTTHWLGVKDQLIEELLCDRYGIDYKAFKLPGHLADQLYDTDREDLVKLADESYKLVKNTL